MKWFFLSLICAYSTVSFAQRFDVHIIGRQDSDTDYSYVVPGHDTATSWSNGSLNANCSSLDLGATSSTNCNGSTNSTTTTGGTITPPQEVSFHVHGATLTMQLPDGRAAVVNCKSKFSGEACGVAREPPRLRCSVSRRRAS